MLYQQEEELDDLAGQVQMLEGTKVRLEMSIEQMRKENRREMAQREEELEEVRIAAQKKVKGKDKNPIHRGKQSKRLYILHMGFWTEALLKFYAKHVMFDCFFIFTFHTFEDIKIRIGTFTLAKS